MWSGFDYRGEPTPFEWPAVSSQYAILDTCGFPKDVYHYYQSWWTDQPVLHLFPHWNWLGNEGQDVDVWCYSNCRQVELFLNGRSLGRKTMPRYAHLEWTVKYAAGALSAKGYNDDGKLIAESRVETTGNPAAIVLKPDRTTLTADGMDISLVAVKIADAQGRTVPVATNLVTFSVTGGGALARCGQWQPEQPRTGQEQSTQRVQRPLPRSYPVLPHAGRDCHPGGVAGPQIRFHCHRNPLTSLAVQLCRVNLPFHSTRSARACVKNVEPNSIVSPGLNRALPNSFAGNSIAAMLRVFMYSPDRFTSRTARSLQIGGPPGPRRA